MLEQKLEELRRATLAAFAEAISLEELEDARVGALGRKGTLAQISRDFAKLTAPEKAALGKLLNAVKEDLESDYQGKKQRFEEAELAERLAKEWIDVTLPVVVPIANRANLGSTVLLQGAEAAARTRNHVNRLIRHKQPNKLWKRQP